MLASDLLDRYADLNSPLHRPDARVKAVCAAVLIVAVLAVPTAQNWRLVLLAAVMLAAAVASRLPAGWLLKRTLILLPFLLITALLLPFAPVPRQPRQRARAGQEADGGREYAAGADGAHL